MGLMREVMEAGILLVPTTIMFASDEDYFNDKFNLFRNLDDYTILRGCMSCVDDHFSSALIVLH